MKFRLEYKRCLNYIYIHKNLRLMIPFCTYIICKMNKILFEDAIAFENMGKRKKINHPLIE